MEAGGPPAKEIIDGMGTFVGAAIQSGVFKDGGGLHPSSRRVRLTFSGGQRTVTRGPYRGGNELLASFVMIKAPSMDAAIEIATRLANAIGDVELEIGPVVESWDLGFGTQPADHVPRFLILRKGEGGPTPPALKKAIEAIAKEGHVVSSAQLAPSSRGARLGRSHHWTDGPFAESKELVAGFSIIELPALADAKQWAVDYQKILGDNEVDVREVE
jgi:hypothetical protein